MRGAQALRQRVWTCHPGSGVVQTTLPASVFASRAESGWVAPCGDRTRGWAALWRKEQFEQEGLGPL